MSVDQETKESFVLRKVPHGHPVFWLCPIMSERTEIWQGYDIRLVT
jgi:hypothetical protein